MNAKLRVLFVAIAVAFSFVSAQAAPKLVGPLPKGAWSPVDAGPKVVYGTDDRIDVFEEGDAQRRAWAASTCALIDESQLSANGDGTYALETFPYTVDGRPPCDGEPFANQPTAAYCTGFVVGVDLVATAGHCVDSAFLDNTRLLFGFEMADAAMPVLTFDESQIYVPIQVVGSALSNNEDWAVLRVDRPIVAPGSQILDIRRAGTIAVGTNVGLIGHPWGLPTKIAFGENSVVRNSSPSGYFVTNLDTFGGNSGSPVFNADTGLVEGILVRGEVDWAVTFTCFRANMFSNTGGRGEEVSKSTTFADVVPGGEGELSLDRTAYQCADVLTASLFDLDLRGDGTTSITLTTVQGDQETVVLTEFDVLGTFEGSIAIGGGEIVQGNGMLDAAEGHSILAVYSDADSGDGTPSVVTAGAMVDCTAPTISDIRVERAGGISFVVAFETAEPSTGIVHAGTECGDLSIESRGAFTRTHEVTVNGLEPETEYVFRVSAEDAAGNVSALTPEMCLSVETGEYRDPFVETFFDLESDLDGMSITFTPDPGVSGYRACTVARGTLPSQATCGRRLLLGDDAHFAWVLPEGKTFTFYGIPYERIFIGSNGYVTFGAGDDEYDPTLASHFDLPRISGYFSDLVPLLGNLLVQEFPDRIAITYENVPDYFDDVHTFQIELFYSGAIRLTWLELTQPFGIVGLSPGGGVPVEFGQSDLSAYAECANLLPEALCGDDSIVVCASPDGSSGAIAWTRVAGDIAVLGVLALALMAPFGWRRPRT